MVSLLQGCDTVGSRARVGLCSQQVAFDCSPLLNLYPRPCPETVGLGLHCEPAACDKSSPLHLSRILASKCHKVLWLCWRQVAISQLHSAKHKSKTKQYRVQCVARPSDVKSGARSQCSQGIKYQHWLLRGSYIFGTKSTFIYMGIQENYNTFPRVARLQEVLLVCPT